MTSETRPAPPGFQRPDLPVGEAGATVRSGQQGPEAWRAGSWAAAPRPQRDVPPVPPPAPPAPPATAVARAPGTRTAARRAAAAQARGERAGMAGALSYGGILICVAAGLYIAWHEGSRGGSSKRTTAATIRAAPAGRAVRLPAPGDRRDHAHCLRRGPANRGPGTAAIRAAIRHKGRMAGPAMKGKHENHVQNQGGKSRR